MALAVYRSLLRSIRIAFEGDSMRLVAARRAARDGFEANKNTPQGSEEQKSQLEHARSVATILRENLVQGRVVSGSENPESVPKYKLKIHEHTERGDNESVKMGGCCSR